MAILNDFEAVDFNGKDDFKKFIQKLLKILVRSLIKMATIKKFARLNGENVVIETIYTDRAIHELFTKDIADQFFECPGDVEQFWTYDEKTGEWNPPAAPEPIRFNRIGCAEFLLRFTREERVAIRGKRGDDLTIEDFFSIIELSPFVDLDAQETKDGVAYLVEQELLTQERADAILTVEVEGE